MENRQENEELKIPDILPLLPVRDVVVYPYMILPLFVGREISIAAVDYALSRDRLIFLATQKDVGDEDPAPEGIYKVGTVAMIMRMLKLPDGRVKILVQGLSKGTDRGISHGEAILFRPDRENLRAGDGGNPGDGSAYPYR